MDLREYMFKYRITNKQMAEFLDCSEPQIALVKRGKPVSKKFARQLERATNGEIKKENVVTNEPIPFPSPEHEYQDEPIEKIALGA